MPFKLAIDKSALTCNTLSVNTLTNKSNLNYDPEIYSTTSSDVIINDKNQLWDKFLRNFGFIWLTKQILPKDADKRSIIKTTLRELLIYCGFLATITYITFSMMSPTMYYQTKIVSELFLDSDSGGITFRSASQMDHFWKFSEKALIDGLYWDHWYNNAKTQFANSILYENYLLGSPKLRQVRVRNNSCEMHEDFKFKNFWCYNSYADNYEDRTGEFLTKEDPSVKNDTAFQWREIKSFAKNDVWGLIGTYSGDGGYIVELTLNKTVAIERIKKLKKHLWIDSATRAIFIDFTTYNPNINLFVVTKLIIEFPATGGALTSWQFRTLYLPESSSDTPILLYLCFTVFLLFIIYYIMEELIEMKTLGVRAYFSLSGWNFVDIIIIIVSILLIFFIIYRGYVINKIFDEAKQNDIKDEHNNNNNNNNSLTQKTGASMGYQIETYQFDTLGFWSSQFSNMLAVLSFVSWVKIFKYISFNKTMSQLSSTLSRCAKDIAGFGVMFFIVFFAFAQLGYLLFGTQVKDYNSFGNAVFTLLRLILGDFDFKALEAANRVLGPIFFLCYIFFVFFVLMNMFLAIINDTYAEVKAEITDDNDFAVMEYFKNISNQILTKLGRQKEQIEGIQQVIKISGLDGSRKMSFSAVRHELKKRDLSDKEIEMLFAKYDLDQNRILDENELRTMLDDLEGKKLQIEKEMADNQNKRPDSAKSIYHHNSGVDLSKLTRRVDKIEYMLSSISSKIDSVLEGKIVTDKPEDNEKVDKQI